jgi:hypothetical protein
MKKSMNAAALFALLLGSPALLSLQACTDLGETPVSAITPENFYRNEQEVLGGLASVYASLRSSLWNYYNLSEISSDEFIVPTRGSDWFDNGRWLQIHRQLWEANSSATGEDINGAWVDAFTGVARANVLLGAMGNVSVTNQEVIDAEIRTLRAFYYYMLMDMFGGVPIVTTTDIVARERNTRAEVFAFIEEELLAVRDALPEQWDDANNGRMTRGAATAILASMYLNAEVFTGTVDVGGLQRGAPRWQDAADMADEILNSGAYSLATDWKSNFRFDNHLSPENILVVKYVAEEGIGFEMIYRGLHYTQATPAPWNGFATIAETYYAFDRDDLRDDIFLVGQQFNVETGQPVDDRTGQPLFFTPEINDITAATEGEGVRIYKFPADPNASGQWHGNDYPYFRLGEIYLIKAEALNELNRTDEAITLINTTIRDRVFSPPEPLPLGLSQAAARDAILNERLFELTAEAKRRQDLIRHDKYLQPWSHKEQREPHRVLMPIPPAQLNANPLLVQNPGY